MCEIRAIVVTSAATGLELTQELAYVKFLAILYPMRVSGLHCIPDLMITPCPALVIV